MKTQAFNCTKSRSFIFRAVAVLIFLVGSACPANCCVSTLDRAKVIRIAKRHHAWFGYGAIEPTISLDSASCVWTVNSLKHKNPRRGSKVYCTRVTVVSVELKIDAFGNVVSKKRKRSVKEYVGGRGGPC
jgi:hypothetical protein